jgi:hypothetical protein
MRRASVTISSRAPCSAASLRNRTGRVGVKSGNGMT